MPSQASGHEGPTEMAPFAPSPVNVRVKISALWIAMLFVFAYVDIFGLFRADVRADIEAGKIAGFAINQVYLLGTTLYVLVPILMVVGSLIMRPRLSRVLNIGLSAILALTIVAGAIGEWTYYVVGTAVEVVLLATIAYYAWTWPRGRRTAPGERDRDGITPQRGHRVSSDLNAWPGTGTGGRAQWVPHAGAAPGGTTT